MVIGLLCLEIFLPYSRSLKDKRKVLNTIRDRVHGRFNAAFAELEFQDKWQRARLGIVTLNRQKGYVEENMDGEIVLSEFQYF
jgi:uncharacterized protein YlxP (DUF503 family)